MAMTEEQLDDFRRTRLAEILLAIRSSLRDAVEGLPDDDMAALATACHQEAEPSASRNFRIEEWNILAGYIEDERCYRQQLAKAEAFFEANPDATSFCPHCGGECDESKHEVMADTKFIAVDSSLWGSPPGDAIDEQNGEPR